MDRKILENLMCPSRSGKNHCRGYLKVKKNLSSEKRSLEIREGVLNCSRCDEEYPILLGIPILMIDIKEYLRQNYYFLTGVAHLNGGLSQEMHSYLVSRILLTLRDSKEALFPQQRRYNRATYSDFLKGISASIINHYENIADIVHEEDPFYEFINRHLLKTPHFILEEMANQYAHGKGIAVEIGCGVGGLTAKLSKLHNSAYGVDTSLETLVLARRIVKHLPEKFGKYRIFLERNRYSFRNLNVDKCKNVEFVCASGSNLPIKDRSIDVVCSSNVLDIIEEPIHFLQEKMRVLKHRGVFLMSDPYDFQPSRMKEFPKPLKKPAIEFIKDKINKRINIIEERDHIPWVIRRYRRNFEVYFNHCLAGIKFR